MSTATRRAASEAGEKSVPNRICLTRISWSPLLRRSLDHQDVEGPVLEQALCDAAEPEVLHRARAPSPHDHRVRSRPASLGQQLRKWNPAARDTASAPPRPREAGRDRLDLAARPVQLLPFHGPSLP